VTTELGYDAFQRRVRKTSGSDSTIYVAWLYERREHAGTVEYVFYVPGEDGPAAEVHFNDETQVEKTLYLHHKDALGSVRVVTDDKGDEERLYFEPFGARIQETGLPVGVNFTPAVEVGFTEHPHDADLWRPRTGAAFPRGSPPNTLRWPPRPSRMPRALRPRSKVNAF
jgi:hypothetical protein